RALRPTTAGARLPAHAAVPTAGALRPSAGSLRHGALVRAEAGVERATRSITRGAGAVVLAALVLAHPLTGAVRTGPVVAAAVGDHGQRGTARALGIARAPGGGDLVGVGDVDLAGAATGTAAARLATVVVPVGTVAVLVGTVAVLVGTVAVLVVLVAEITGIAAEIVGLVVGFGAPGRRARA